MSLTDTLRSATYNPEAEKAIAADREKAKAVRKQIQTLIDSYTKTFMDVSSKSYTPKWTLNAWDTLIKESQNWLLRNADANEQVTQAKFEEIKKRGEDITQINTYLYTSQSFEKVMRFISNDLEQKKSLPPADRKAYQEFYNQLKGFNSSNTNPKLVDTKIFFDKFQRDVEAFSRQKGIWDRQQTLLQTAFSNPAKFEADFGAIEQQAQAAKTQEEQKFSFQRFTKKVTGTATTVIGSLLYVVFCLTMGMLAANQAIGREPAYRVLYFLYGAIFAPILVFYYLYLWYTNKSPKIYTLLPLTQTPADTTIGTFLLFPFFYREDKPARDLMVEFLTQSAEAVGKPFDPKTLGSIGKQVETVAENMKNLVAETKEGAETAAKAAAEALPKLTQLRVNA